jgi:hypothetical protein
MNRDLEALTGADPALRALAARLQAGPQARLPDGFALRVHGAIASAERRRRRPVVWSAAAGLMVLLAAGTLLCRPQRPGGAADLVACQRADGSFSASTAAPYVQAFAVMALARCPGVDRQALTQAVDVLVRTQNAGGGWANDRVSAYNVAALEEAAAAGVPSAGTAYKRGARYLTRHGIPTVTREGLVRIARAAVRQPIPDDGLARCLASAAQL